MVNRHKKQVKKSPAAQNGVDKDGGGVVQYARATDHPKGWPYGAVAFPVGHTAGRNLVF